MTLKRKLLALVSSLFFATSVFAAPSISGPHVTMQTDGSLSTGQANIITNNAGPIQFFTNKTLCGYFDGSTCALTGVSIGTPTLTNPTISGNLTFSTAAAKIIPGATSLTFRNNADSASNLTIADAGGITVRNNIVASAVATGSLGSLAIPWVNLFSGSVAIDSDVTAVSNTSPGIITAKNTSSDSDTLDVIAFGANAVGSNLNAFKTRATTTDANTIVNSGDTIFQLTGLAADGASYRRAAAIVMTVDGTPGSSDMPGAIDFQTSPDGSATLASVLKLSNNKAAVFTGTVTSTAAADIGWNPVAAANQACNTTCATSGCVFGFNLTAGVPGTLLACTDATADVCLCAGAS